MAGYPNQPSAVIAFACFVCRLIFAYVIHATDGCKECLGCRVERERNKSGGKAEASVEGGEGKKGGSDPKKRPQVK